MAKKQKAIPKKDFNQIIGILPKREQEKLRQTNISVEYLTEGIQQAKKAMQMDIYFGLPWFIAYTVSLYFNAFDNITIGIFVIGLVYFTYNIFKRGSYGLNRRKAKVFEQLLSHLN